MVLVEEVPEEVLLREGEKESDFETDSDVSDGIDSDDEFIEDETLYDRLVALKDIVPPQQRAAASEKYAAGKSWFKWSLTKAGQVAWIVSTSALLIGLPLALAIEDETRITQQEREMQMQTQGQQQLLGGGGQQQGQGVLPPGF